MKDFKERFMHLATTVPGAIIILGAFAFFAYILHAEHTTVPELISIAIAIAGGGGLLYYKKKPEGDKNAK